MKSHYEISLETMNAFFTKYPQACEVATYHGHGLSFGYPANFLQRLSYKLGTFPFNPNPSIFIRVEKKTKHPPGVPKTFEYDGRVYEIVYEIRPMARAC